VSFSDAYWLERDQDSGCEAPPKRRVTVATCNAAVGELLTGWLGLDGHEARVLSLPEFFGQLPIDSDCALVVICFAPHDALRAVRRLRELASPAPILLVDRDGTLRRMSGRLRPSEMITGLCSTGFRSAVEFQVRRNKAAASSF
jgi:hypothetical protein